MVTTRHAGRATSSPVPPTQSHVACNDATTHCYWPSINHPGQGGWQWKFSPISIDIPETPWSDFFSKNSPLFYFFYMRVHKDKQAEATKHFTSLPCSQSKMLSLTAKVTSPCKGDPMLPASSLKLPLCFQLHKSYFVCSLAKFAMLPKFLCFPLPMLPAPGFFFTPILPAP